MATALRDVRRRPARRCSIACSTASARRSPASAPEPEPPVVRLEELLLTRIANENPALGPLRELVDDRILADGTRYDDAIAGLEAVFADGPADPGDGTGRR